MIRRFVSPAAAGGRRGLFANVIRLKVR